MEWLAWIAVNYDKVLLILAMLVSVAEVIVRMTPTEKDDGFVERLGAILRIIMDYLKIPNLRKKK